MTFMSDYYYGNEAEQYIFYRIPKVLMSEPHFKTLTSDAKILYGLMLDRMGLSIKNDWKDKDGKIYIYFTLEDIQEYMNCGHTKGVKVIAELEKIRLIERIKQGQGKPTRIYVKKFINANKDSQDLYENQDFSKEEVQTSTNEKSRLPQEENTDFPKEEVQTSANKKSRLPETRSADFTKADTNNNKYNKTDFNDIEYQSIYPDEPTQNIDEPQKEIDMIDKYREIIKSNIDYECLIHDYPFRKKEIDNLVAIMVEAVTTKKDYSYVSSEKKPSAIVKSVLLKLNFTHIEYVLECLDKTTSKIGNIKSYLLTSLYNAPQTIDMHYKTLVNHDMYGGN